MMLSVRSYGEYSFAPFGFLYCLLSVLTYVKEIFDILTQDKL